MPAHLGNKYALGNDGGRPTTLTPDLMNSIEQEAEDYSKWCEDNPIIAEKRKLVTESGKQTETIESETRIRLPTLAGLAVRLEIPKSTLLTWVKEKEEFAIRIARFIDRTEDIKWVYGAAGTMNAHIAKFGLSALHDYRDKSDMTSGGKALPAPILGGITQKHAEDEGVD